jgi:hypothetical protein
MRYHATPKGRLTEALVSGDRMSRAATGLCHDGSVLNVSLPPEFS